MAPQPTNTSAPVALVTGGSAGLGLALIRALHARGWRVVTDGRDPERLHGAIDALPGGSVDAVPGDVADPAHREAIAAAVRRLGRLDVIVHNASSLGPVPLVPLKDLTVESLMSVLAVNLAAPLALTASLIDLLRATNGLLVGISSDAAIEHYPTWGGYGASKAALDHLLLTFAQEEGITAYAVDPGDMRTALHAAAVPDEDPAGLPLPETVVPHLLHLLDARPASGRYRAADLPSALQELAS